MSYFAISRETGYMALNVAAATAIVVVNKAVLARFPFPSLLAAAHAGATWAVLRGGLGVSASADAARAGAVLAALNVASIVLSNWNLAVNPVLVFQSSRSLATPLTFALENLVADARHPRELYMPLLAVCVGSIASLPDDAFASIATGGDDEAVASRAVTLPGLLIAAAAALAAAGSIVGSAVALKRALPPGAKRDGFELLLAQMPYMVAFSVMLWASDTVVTQRAPALVFSSLSSGLTVSVGAAVLVSCVLAATLNFTAFVTVGAYSALAYQMLGQLKSVLVVLIGVLVFSERVNARQAVGLTLSSGGLYYFARLKLATEESARTTVAASAGRSASAMADVADDETAREISGVSAAALGSVDSVRA